MPCFFEALSKALPRLQLLLELHVAVRPGVDVEEVRADRRQPSVRLRCEVRGRGQEQGLLRQLLKAVRLPIARLQEVA